MTTGEALRRLRRDAGVKQKLLSLASGVSQGQISEIERGRVQPYRRTLWKLAHGLEVLGCRDAWDLTGGDRSIPGAK